MNSDSTAGRPRPPGMKIGFLLAGSPDQTRVQAVLMALPLLEGVESVRLVWSDVSQAEYSGMSSFSAPSDEVVDRLSDELLYLPGFRVQIQGVNRVPYPVLVFRAEPGLMDRRAVERRTSARASLVQRDLAHRGTGRIDRSEAAVQPDVTQPSRAPGAGVTPRAESATPGIDDPDRKPPETTWLPGRMALTVRKPGFENVTPRLQPAGQAAPDPVEPVVRSHYPRPSPVDGGGQSGGGQGLLDMADADWVLEVSGEAVRSEDASEAGHEDVLLDSESLGTDVFEPSEPDDPDGPDRPVQADPQAAWEVLVSDYYPELGDQEPSAAPPFGTQSGPAGEMPAGLLRGADDDQAGRRLYAIAPEGEVVAEKRAGRFSFLPRRRARTKRRRPRRSFWRGAISALFGAIEPDGPNRQPDAGAGESGGVSSVPEGVPEGSVKVTNSEPDREPASEQQDSAEPEAGDEKGGDSPA